MAKERRLRAKDYRKIKAPDAITYQRSERWVDFGLGPGTIDDRSVAQVGNRDVAATQAVTDQITLNDPTQWGAEAPISRPDVPEIEEQLPPEATNDNSILGGFANFMDNIVPDDMGGLIKGEVGWLSNIPGYEQTVGKVAFAPFAGAAATLDAANWGSDQVSRAITAAISAAPGGIETLTWDQTADVSTMQAAIASIGIEAKRIREGGVRPSDILLANPVTGPFLLAGYLADDSPVQADDFNILDRERKDQAFSQGWERFFSGLGDAGVTIGTDPFIVGGAASSIIRYGTKGGKIAGVSNQQLKTPRQAQNFANKLDEQAAIIRAEGIDGARASGRLSSEGEHLAAALEWDAAQNASHIWTKNSINQSATQSLLGRTTPDKPEEAAALVGAMAGHAPSWRKLRELNAQLYDDLSTASNVEAIVPTPPVGSLAPQLMPISEESLKLADDIVDIAKRNPVEQELRLNRVDGAGQIIERGGARTNRGSMARAANAWRAGGTRTQFDNNPFRPTSTSSPQGRKGNWVYDFIEGASASRPITAVRWLGRSSPSGVVYMKGVDNETSGKEVAAWLRKSPMSEDEAATYYGRYLATRTVEERKLLLEEMESVVVRRLAEAKGLNPDQARKLYDGYVAKRAYALGQTSTTKNGLYVDDLTGGIVTVPDFYTELDQAFPLLDTKVFSSVMDSNREWLRGVEDVRLAADYANSLWKISVLLRLGYTQRNIAEGTLRSFATLGLIAANPRAWATLPANARYVAAARRYGRQLKGYDRRLQDSYNNLQQSRNLLLAARSDAGVDEWAKLIDEAQDLTPTIRALERKAATKKGLTKKEQARLDRARKKRQTRIEKAEAIKTQRINPRSGEMASLQRQQQLLLKEIDDLQGQVDEAAANFRERMSKRRVGGYSENRMDDGTLMPGAFMGDDGRIAALTSAADRTNYATFQWDAGARSEMLRMGGAESKLNPAKLTPKQMGQYWNEYTTLINNRYRGDIVARYILEGKSVDFIKNWLRTPAGRSYRNQLSIQGRLLDNEQAIDSWLVNINRRLDQHVPDVGNLRATVLDHEITKPELLAALKGRELPTLVGRLIDESEVNLAEKAFRGLNNFTGSAMRYLGTIPETKLLRHPYYNSVYTARQRELYNMAYQQGRDMTDPNTLGRINKAAHRSALKATKDTMYTIERLSNAAVMLRFVSPFFPAWENSVRVLGRIAWQKPQVIGYANLLWNLPNNLGWVVDENGNKVEWSSFLRDDGQYIIWPEPMQQLMESRFGPFTPGQAVMSRQQGLNVVFPGGDFWFPGVGPMVQVPVTQVLRGKPEDQEILKNFFGENVYNQITPFGNVSNSLLESVMPTAIRRLNQMRNGVTSDGAYLISYNQILEDAYIAAQIEDRTLTKQDYKEIERTANNFWRWQILAAGALPFQVRQMSRYQLQRDKWNQLIDDQSIPYNEKIRLFLEDQGSDFFAGENFAAITRSASVNETKLMPNLKTWQRISKNRELVKDLNDIDPELVGMFGNMGSWDDPFSYAVYGEFARHSVGMDGKPVRSRMTPSDVARNNEIKDGWNTYWKIKDALEEKAIAAGLSGLQVKEAKPLSDLLDQAIIDITERYPAWGEERTIYTEKLPQFILGARKIVANQELMDEDSSVRKLSEYLRLRDGIAEALDGVTDEERRDQIKELAYQGIFKLRQEDIGFADLYDQYLSRDDFRKVL